VFKFREILPTGNRRNRALFTVKNIWLPIKLSLILGSRLRSARAIPQQCTQSAPDVVQIGSLSADL